LPGPVSTARVLAQGIRGDAPGDRKAFAPIGDWQADARAIHGNRFAPGGL